MDATIGKSNLLHKLKLISNLDNLPSQLSWFTNTEVYYDQTRINLKTVQELTLHR